MEGKEQQKNTRIGYLPLGVILIILIISIATCGGGDSEPSISETEIAQMDITEYAEHLVNVVVGKKTNTDVPVFRQAIDTTSYLSIDMNSSENLTTNLFKIGLLNDSIDIYKKAFKDRPDLQGLKLVWYTTLVDMKGNELEGSVMWILITKENAATINWDNMLGDNLPKVADGYWEHNLFSSE
jgi:hypothetical protein